jgi:hypothetical protein
MFSLLELSAPTGRHKNSHSALPCTKAGLLLHQQRQDRLHFPVPRDAWDSSARAHWRNRKPASPSSVFNFITTHESRIRMTGGEWSKTTAQVSRERRTRRAWRFLRTGRIRLWSGQLATYELVTQVDYQIAAVLDELSAMGWRKTPSFFGEIGNGCRGQALALRFRHRIRW